MIKYHIGFKFCTKLDGNQTDSEANTRKWNLLTFFCKSLLVTTCYKDKDSTKLGISFVKEKSNCQKFILF